MQQSAAGDLILLFIGFDGAVILQAEDFASFSHSLPNPSDLRAFYLLLIAITSVLWAFAVFRIERRMQAVHAAGQAFSMARAATTIGYIGTAAVAAVLNTAPFTVRP